MTVQITTSHSAAVVQVARRFGPEFKTETVSEKACLVTFDIPADPNHTAFVRKELAEISKKEDEHRFWCSVEFGN